MTYGSPWSENFIAQLSDKEFRDAFVADQVRTRIAQLVRVLREHPDRKWSQDELGVRSEKKQNVISRLENPDEKQPTVQTLLNICSAFDLPLWIDFPEWEEWLVAIKDFPSSKTRRLPFDARRLNSALSWRSTASSGSRFMTAIGENAVAVGSSGINDNQTPTFAVATA